MRFFVRPADDPHGTGLPPWLRQQLELASALNLPYGRIGSALSDDPQRTGLHGRLREHIEGDTPPLKFHVAWGADRSQRGELERVMQAAKTYVAAHPYQVVQDEITDDPEPLTGIIGHLRFDRDLDAIREAWLRER